ncbi:MAG: extracellular solute-binding protein [Micrococcales bacterium]|nr:extracellular solute-binding protein [Micrococcales bacterium]
MRTTVLSRRGFAAAAVSFVAVLGLAACSSSTPPASHNTPAATAGPGAGATSTGAAASGGPQLSTGDVTLTVDWWGGDARVKTTTDAIALFEKKYPNIHIDPTYSDWNGYWDKLATAVAGGNAPDVMQMDEEYLASYAANGTLYDLSQASQLDTSQLDPGVLGLGLYQNTQYAVPISTTGFGVLVNDTALQKLGLTLPDTSTWTWDQFATLAQQISQAGGGSVFGTAPMNNGYSLRLWARQNGDELFSNGKVSIKPATAASYFQLALDWTDSGAAASASHQAEVASVALAQSDTATGKQVLTFTQSTQITAYQAASGGQKFELVPLPTSDANQTPYMYLKPGMYWSVSAKSAHPAEAALFVNFMLNDPSAAAVLGTERGIPANPQMVTSIMSTLAATDQQAAQFDTQIAQSLGKAPEITPNGASTLDTVIARYIQAVTAKQQSPADAATAFIAELQGDIDNAS